MLAALTTLPTVLRLPRYRTGDPQLDGQVAALVDEIGGDHPDLIFELIVSAVRLARDGAARGDVKIANAALKEMRYAFHVFAPYRGQRKVSIFGSARTRPDDPLYELTRRYAAAMAARDWMVITGAGPGIMTAGIEGAGTENSFGVNIRLPFEAATSQFIADDPKLINFRYFFTRKLSFMKESHGFVVLPGGFGTLDECFELLTLVQTGKSQPAPIVLLDVPGGTYWAEWVDVLRHSVLGGRYVSPEDLALFTVTDDIDVAVAEVDSFYANYHSLRFVGRQLVVRVHRLPDAATRERLSTDFSDIIVAGGIEHVPPSAPEIADNDHVDLPRVAFMFDRTHWARLRQLIDALNSD
jgi:uncharacterized protein (TIGR00730 family)